MPFEQTTSEFHGQFRGAVVEHEDASNQEARKMQATAYRPERNSYTAVQQVISNAWRMLWKSAPHDRRSFETADFAVDLQRLPDVQHNHTMQFMASQRRINIVITKNDLTVPEESAFARATFPAGKEEHALQRRLTKFGMAASVALLALGLLSAGTASAQPKGLDIVPLAQGLSEEPKVDIQATGPNDILQALLVFHPGGETGWHIHPGPVVVVVKTGALTEISANGCVTVHPAGSVFFESKDEVHTAINQTGGVTEVYATFISPSGAAPLQPVPDPGGICQRQRR